MSYILDALRRADAERERGHVPGLHTHRTAVATATRRPPALRAGLAGLGAGAALALVALLVWRHGADDAPAVVTARVPPTLQLPGPAPVQVPAAAALQAPSPVIAPVTPPVPQARAEQAPVVASAVPAVVPAPETIAAVPARKRTAPAVLAASAAPAASAPKVARLDELPDEIRRQLPALAVNGSAFSASPASRFVIVNGQLFHEGDTLAPGLVLEQIRLKSAVLAFKGYRWGISF